MKQFILEPKLFPKDQIRKILDEHDVLINHYAEEYFSHAGFNTDQAEKVTVLVASLNEIGFENGASLDEIFDKIKQTELKPCPPNTGLFLRLAWKDQPQSSNSILSGTHQAPDQAVTVLSEMLEQDDDFPKGLYLRNVDGNNWLRGYVCPMEYRFPADAMFAFMICTKEG